MAREPATITGDPEPGRRVEEPHRREWGRLRGALTRGCWPGEGGGGPARSGTSCVIGEENMFGFLWLVLNWQWEQIL